MQNEFTADMKSEAIVSDGNRTIGYVDGEPAEWEGNLSHLESGSLFWTCGDDFRFHDGNEEYTLVDGEWKTGCQVLNEDTEEDTITKHVRSNYDYYGESDPINAVSVYQFDALSISIMTGNEGYAGKVKPGDWMIEDGVCGEVVRVVDGNVKQIWSNL